MGSSNSTHAPNTVLGKSNHHQSLDRNNPFVPKDEVLKDQKDQENKELSDIVFFRSPVETITEISDCKINLTRTQDRAHFEEERNYFQNNKESFQILLLSRKENECQNTSDLQCTNLAQEENRGIRPQIQLLARSEAFSNISVRGSHFLWLENLNPLNPEHILLNSLRSVFGATSTEYAGFSHYSTGNTSDQEIGSDDPYNINYPSDINILEQQVLLDSIQVFYGLQTGASSSNQ